MWLAVGVSLACGKALESRESSVPVGEADERSAGEADSETASPAEALAGRASVISAFEPIEAGADPFFDDAWPSPRCFGYSAERHVFACMGGYATNEIGRLVVGFVDLVGPSTAIRRRVFANVAPDTADVLAQEEERGEPFWSLYVSSLADEEALAAEWTRAAVKRVELPSLALIPGEWQTVGAYGVLYRLATHEGGASFENRGDVVLRCPGGVEIPIDVRATGMELGDDARAFVAPGGDWLAVGVDGSDGGEDVFYLSIDTVVIDAAGSCREGRGLLFGPAPYVGRDGLHQAESGAP